MSVPCFSAPNYLSMPPECGVLYCRIDGFISNVCSYIGGGQGNTL
jgi:hypothetical protein